MVPLFLIVAVPAFDVLKKPTTALGFAAPEPLLLMVEPPAVELSKKLMSPVAFVLLSVAVPAVEVSKNSMLLPLPLSVMVDVPAVLWLVNVATLFVPLLVMFAVAAVLWPLNVAKLFAPLLAMVAAPADPFVLKTTELPVPLFVIVEFWAVVVSPNRVCVLLPLFRMKPVPPFELPVKSTTELGNAPDALLLIVAPPSVAVSKKFTDAVAFVLLIVEVPPVAVLKKLVELSPLELTSTAFAAVATPLKSSALPPAWVIVWIAAELFTMPTPLNSMPAVFVMV